MVGKNKFNYYYKFIILYRFKFQVNVNYCLLQKLKLIKNDEFNHSTINYFIGLCCMDGGGSPSIFFMYFGLI